MTTEEWAAADEERTRVSRLLERHRNVISVAANIITNSAKTMQRSMLEVFHLEQLQEKQRRTVSTRIVVESHDLDDSDTGSDTMDTESLG